MMNIIAFACLTSAVFMLYALSVCDLKTGLLPDRLVAGFAIMAPVFHMATHGRFMQPADIAFGGLVGFAALYIVRVAAGRLYGREALGLGDVKLMGAAGLWLGPQALMLALAAGAGAAALHGLCSGLHAARVAHTKVDFVNLKVPAGPGLIAGIVLAGLYRFFLLGMHGA